MIPIQAKQNLKKKNKIKSEGECIGESNSIKDIGSHVVFYREFWKVLINQLPSRCFVKFNRTSEIAETWTMNVSAVNVLTTTYQSTKIFVAKSEKY